MTESEPWLSRADSSSGATVDDVGPVIREYRRAAGQNQVQVASVLEVTQQNLSQMEHGQRPVSLDLRRKLAQVLGIPAENLGLSNRGPRPAVASDGADPNLAADRGRWRTQRDWLNGHRSALAKLAVELYAPELRVGQTPLMPIPIGCHPNRWSCALSNWHSARSHRRPH